nr:hypothetical protein [Saprospiraceae bacterium]
MIGQLQTDKSNKGLFKDEKSIGTICVLKENVSAPQTFYQHPNGKLFNGNSIEWMKKLESASIDLIFADPPYNIKKADWDNFENQEKYIEFSLQWIE